MHFHLSPTSTHSTLIRTFIFTCGHYCIDVLSTHFITGAEIQLAMTACIVGPILNAIWYFILDKLFVFFVYKKNSHKQK